MGEELLGKGKLHSMGEGFVQNLAFIIPLEAKTSLYTGEP